MEVQRTFWQNLRDLPASISLSAIVAGFIVTLVGFTGPLLIVVQAAQSAALSPSQAASWVWAIAVGNGIFSILMSLYYRQPLIAPWPTAGAALLVTGLVGVPYAEAIGAYIVAGALLVILGWTGLFERAMALIPTPVVMGMLAGVLLRFGVDLFAKLPENPLMVLAMIAVYFILRRYRFSAPALGSLGVGVLVALIQGQMNMPPLALALTIPEITLPQFNLASLVSLALPLFALSITGQFAPGQAVLIAAGYKPRLNGILVALGGASMLMAFFGGHGQSLGALTSAMLANPEAHPDPRKRYSAAVMMGVFYTTFGAFGATVLALFSAFPAALVAAIAGLSLSGTIGSSLYSALNDARYRDAGLMAFLCTAGNFTLLGIGAPFWGLVAGMATVWLTRPR